MTKTRKLHKWIGVLLLCPMLAWTFTGLIFFLKPGYDGAYENLHVKTYSFDDSINIVPSASWDEIRLVKTVLGLHLLVRAQDKNIHLDPDSLQVRDFPSRSEFSLLVNDAIRENPRYGEIVSVQGIKAVTSTGVTIALDWQGLSFRQRGKDTRLISMLYNIHYLQWTPWVWFNQVLGVTGLILLLGLTVLGTRLLFRSV